MNMPLLLEASKGKLTACLDIFFASVTDYIEFEPKRRYTPKELEPYDALSDRYLRAFESSTKFFRALERFREVTPSESFRDLLNRMEKYGAITSVEMWIDMRDTRNRIAHEYLPDELARIYRDIIGAAAKELHRLHSLLAVLAESK